MDRSDAKALPAGSDVHYSSYVGPPAEYDFMGATQFRLACALGLREHHKLLDFGCGSLRAGRLFLMYLNRGCYFGIDPTKKIIDDAIAHETGAELVAMKAPRFDHNADFRSDVFGETFDFIIAQSIFSHAGPDLVVKGLRGFADVLAQDGIALATFVPEGRLQESGEQGWIYPGCVAYRPSTVAAFAAEAGLACVAIPWFHRRQDWYVFARDAAQLPSAHDAAQHLTGATLRAPSLQHRDT